MGNEAELKMELCRRNTCWNNCHYIMVETDSCNSRHAMIHRVWFIPSTAIRQASARQAKIRPAPDLSPCASMHRLLSHCFVMLRHGAALA